MRDTSSRSEGGIRAVVGTTASGARPGPARERTLNHEHPSQIFILIGLR